MQTSLYGVLVQRHISYCFFMLLFYKLMTKCLIRNAPKPSFDSVCTYIFSSQLPPSLENAVNKLLKIPTDLNSSISSLYNQS
eukprot:CCRYP_003706-RA/>CCRYP_003706-RA protein AED:0.55 eAED:0.62 QI:0/0/0.5/1/0/0/2/118/81